jgi:hypothetical protein
MLNIRISIPGTIPRLDRTQPLRLRGLTDAWPLRRLSYEAFVAAEGATFRVRRAAALHEYGYAGPSCGQVPGAAWLSKSRMWVWINTY